MTIDTDSKKIVSTWIWPPQTGWAVAAILVGAFLVVVAVAQGEFGAGIFFGVPTVIFYFIAQRAGLLKRDKEIQIRYRDLLIDETTRQVTELHVKTLWAQIYQVRVVDPYGNVDVTKGNERVSYFIDKVIIPELCRVGVELKYLEFLERVALTERIRKQAMTVVEDYVRSKPDDKFEDVKTGIDYENYCQKILEADGWSVSTTPVTGDQGADLIANKNGSRLAIQCKMYSQPVGNKAVQEVFAAKKFQNADFAAVVTNAAYTASAKQLATANGVLLLHHDELRGITTRLSNGV